MPDANVVLPDLNAALNRLLQNQADIGNAIKPFYGDAAGDQLTELLRDHILIAGEILQAAKTGMDQMLKDDLDATTAEVLARLNSNWTADVAAYDNVHIQALAMADMLSDGIIAQFPARFRP